MSTVDAPRDESVQQRFLRRLRNYRLSDDEKKLIEQTKRRASGYSSLAAMVAGVGAFAYSRKRKMAPLASIFFYTGVILLGSQMGSIYGMYRGAKDLNELPNSELRRILTEFRAEFMREKLGRALPKDVPYGDEPIMSDKAVENAESGSFTIPSHSSPTSKSVQQQLQEKTGSAWDQMHAKSNEATTAWDRLRTQNSTDNIANAVKEPEEQTNSLDEIDDRTSTTMTSNNVKKEMSRAASSTVVTSSGEDAWSKIRQREVEGQMRPQASSTVPISESGSVGRVNQYGDRID